MLHRLEYESMKQELRSVRFFPASVIVVLTDARLRFPPSGAGSPIGLGIEFSLGEVLVCEHNFVSNKDLLGTTPALCIFPVAREDVKSNSVGYRLDSRQVQKRHSIVREGKNIRQHHDVVCPCKVVRLHPCFGSWGGQSRTSAVDYRASLGPNTRKARAVITHNAPSKPNRGNKLAVCGSSAGCAAAVCCG
jgi:hypothetical protein